MSKQTIKKTCLEYFIIAVSTLILAVGVYFFKFPNNFSFGGVTGLAVVISNLFSPSPSVVTLVINMVLLVLGFIFLGKDFGFKTVFSSAVLSVGLWGMELIYPMTEPLTRQPLLELIFAIFLPAVGSAILFNIGASSGGTDIVAMIMKKYTSINIGNALMLSDLLITFAGACMFGIETGLFSFLGLIGKSLVIDNVIESINMCKYFHIVCSDPEPICDFITKSLHRSATVYKAEGAYTHKNKTVIMTAMKRGQAVQLRNFVRSHEPGAFMLISNTSEIIGKGFRGF